MGVVYWTAKTPQACQICTPYDVIGLPQLHCAFKQESVREPVPVWLHYQNILVCCVSNWGAHKSGWHIDVHYVKIFHMYIKCEVKTKWDMEMVA